MKRAVIISAILHVLVVAVTYFGLPIFFDPPKIESSPPMAVEIIMPEQVPQKPVPKPVAQPEPVVPPPPPMAMPELAPEPVPPLPKVKPKSKLKPKPKVAKKAKPKKPAKVARVAPKPKRRPPPPDEFRKLLKDLTKRKKPVPKVAKKTPKIVKLQPTPIQSAYARRQVENELSKKVRQQIVPCWNIPGGAKNAQKMKIGVRIRLNRDGSLLGNPRVIDTKRFRSDQSFRVVAESAVRALLNPRCSPLRLPYGQYEIWKDITFNFDPSEALGP
jgi:outer membrane biosynthesis protein TonB